MCVSTTKCMEGWPRTGFILLNGTVQVTQQIAGHRASILSGRASQRRGPLSTLKNRCVAGRHKLGGTCRQGPVFLDTGLVI